MFSPSELEGEVDHSFFDSDCDDATRNEGQKMERGLKAEKESQQREDTLPSKQSDSKGRDERSPKKLIRNQVARSPSPSLSKSSVDAESESSSRSRSSSSGRSSLHSPTPPRPNKPSSSQRVRRTRVGSAGSRDVHVGRSAESEDTVTDVSPLSSPDISPLQSLDLNCSAEAEEGSLKEQQQQQEESVPSSGLSDLHQDEDSYQDIDECSLRLESQLGGKPVFSYPGGRNRKNYSFSNDEVRRIDRENQRLLRKLSPQSPGPRPPSAARKKTHSASKWSHTAHSTVNRQREQQRIERENLVFLQKLESVKATPGLKRSEQLEDYQRLTGYAGNRSYPVCLSTPRERATRKTPSAGSRPASSVLHSSRGVYNTSDSSKTPVPRTKKLSAVQPAWS